MTSFFLSMGSWSLGIMSNCLIVVFPLKFTLMPYLPQMCFKLSDVPCMYGMTTCPMVLMGPGFVLVVLVS